MNAVVCYETPVGGVHRDPERWTTTADSEAKAICRPAHADGCARGKHANYRRPRDRGPGS